MMGRGKCGAGRLAGVALGLALIGLIAACNNPASGSPDGSTPPEGGSTLSAKALWAQTVSSGSSNSYFNSVAADSSGNIYAVGYVNGSGAFGFGNSVTATGTNSGYNIALVKYDASGTAQWAQTVSSGSGNSCFNSVTTDSSGNVYALGYITGNAAYDFGNGVTTTGTYSSGASAVLVKYNASGAAQWAKTVSSGSSYCYFNGAAIDSSGNVYAAGEINGTYDFACGSGVTVTGIRACSNVVLVKYDAAGTTLWARTTSSAFSDSYFKGVTTDSSGNVYATGFITGNTPIGFGNSVTATGVYSTGGSLALVKYNSSGTAQWAQTVSSGSGASQFNGVIADNSGNVYAAGYISGIGSYGFGNSVTATGATGSSASLVLVKYNTLGTAQWAQTTSSGANSNFNGVSIDSSGNVYAAGSIYKNGSYGFGNSVTATGTCGSGTNLVLVKYSASGTAQWAKTVSSGLYPNRFYGVATDNSGNIYAAGYAGSNSVYDFGNSVTATGVAGVDNAVLAKFQ